MTNSFSLDDMKAALDAEFAPVTFTVGNDTLVLQNLMRIDATPRKEVLEAMAQLRTAEGAEEDKQDLALMGEAVTTILRNVVAGGKGQKLVDALGGDLLLSMKVLEKWTGATQAPEAGNSSD